MRVLRFARACVFLADARLMATEVIAHAEACGVVIPSFGANPSHFNLASQSAQRIATLIPPRDNWCGGGSSGMAGFPVIIFTDFETQSWPPLINKTLRGHAPAFRLASIVNALALPAHSVLHTMLRARNSYGWKLWKPLALLARRPCLIPAPCCPHCNCRSRFERSTL